MKDREEKAEADIIYRHVEGDVPMKRNQRKTKRAAAAEKNVMVAVTRRQNMLKVKAKAQEAAAPKKTRQQVSQKVKKT